MLQGDEIISGLTCVALDDKTSNEPSHDIFAGSRTELDDSEQSKRLEGLLGEAMAMVRLRAAPHEQSSGAVLLDAVVGDIRCVCIDQEPRELLSLSPRQQQIAGMVAAGRTNHAIARSLEISVWTVSTHLRRIFAKLSVSSRSEMVAHLLAHPDVALATDLSGY
jgi:DNA-binding CsgD family transcriptional regulator